MTDKASRTKAGNRQQSVGSNGQRGEALAAELDDRINEAAEASEGDTPENIVGMLAEASDLDAAAVNQMLNAGSECPTRDTLEAFAGVLDVDVSTLIEAAEQDGCDYSPSEEESQEETEESSGPSGESGPPAE